MDTKKQVLVIHGSGSYFALDHTNFLESLRAYQVSLDRIRSRVGWKANLQEDLGDLFEIFTPRMPLADRPQYEAWKIVFDKVLTQLNDGVVVVGHSLGGLFLMKYFSEYKGDKKIRALITIAAPYVEHHTGLGFELGASLVLSSAVEQVYLFHSEDDEVVPISALEEYAKRFSQAKVKKVSGYKHVNTEHFPELVKCLTSL